MRLHIPAYIVLTIAAASAWGQSFNLAVGPPANQPSSSKGADARPTGRQELREQR